MTSTRRPVSGAEVEPLDLDAALRTASERPGGLEDLGEGPFVQPLGRFVDFRGGHAERGTLSASAGFEPAEGERRRRERFHRSLWTEAPPDHAVG
jgi:hypothetical protein